jgi:hypothetical protein
LRKQIGPRFQSNFLGLPNHHCSRKMNDIDLQVEPGFLDFPSCAPNPRSSFDTLPIAKPWSGFLPQVWMMTPVIGP